jgi:hypothetical protein
MTRCWTLLRAPLPLHAPSSWKTDTKSRRSIALTLTRFSLHPPVPLYARLLTSWCLFSCKGVSSFLSKSLLASPLQWVALHWGAAPQFLLPGCSFIVTLSCPCNWFLPCCLQQYSHYLALPLSIAKGMALPLLLRSCMGGCLLAAIQLALMLLCLSVMPCCSVLVDIASTMLWPCCMSILPWHCALAVFPIPMEGSSIQTPTMDGGHHGPLPYVMVGRYLPMSCSQSMGGITSPPGMSHRSSMEVRPTPRAMVGIPVCLHWLPRVLVTLAHCSTLLCHRTITFPLLAWTL